MGITESSMKKATLDKARAINRRMWEITYILSYLKCIFTVQCDHDA